MKFSIPKSALIPASDYVIFGGAGDLATRKILPALFWRFLDGQINEGFNIFLCSRRDISVEDLEPKVPNEILKIRKKSRPAWQGFKKLITIIKFDLSNGLGAEVLKFEITKKAALNRPIIFYLALSSELFGRSCELIKKQGLDLPQSRIVIEKPFGRDYSSAQTLNQIVQSCALESQIFRIDHYLGKETVQNILVLRFANTIFEPIWNRNYISSVQITSSETVGVEDRAGYYESSGALRDMVQNHLTQMLALTAMEPPGHFDPEAIRNEKAKVLQAVKLANEEKPWECCVRGQYSKGGSEEDPLLGYREEPGVNPNSTTFFAFFAT